MIETNIENIISTADEFLLRYTKPTNRNYNREYNHYICGLTLPVQLEDNIIKPVKIWRKCFGHGAQGCIVDGEGETDKNIWFGGTLLEEALNRFKEIRGLNDTAKAIRDYKSRRKIATGRYAWAGGSVYHLESEATGLAVCGIEIMQSTLKDENDLKERLKNDGWCLPICKTCLKIAGDTNGSR